MKKIFFVICCILSGVLSSVYYKEELIEMLIPIVTYLTPTPNPNKSSSTLTKTDKKNVYVLNYTFNEKEYKMFIPIKKGPQKIVRIEDENHQDIFELVHPFLGPNENTHALPLTPKQLGYKMIYCYTREDEEYIFSDDDLIDFSKKLVVKENPEDVD